MCQEPIAQQGLSHQESHDVDASGCRLSYIGLGTVSKGFHHCQPLSMGSPYACTKYYHSDTPTHHPAHPHQNIIHSLHYFLQRLCVCHLLAITIFTFVYSQCHGGISVLHAGDVRHDGEIVSFWIRNWWVQCSYVCRHSLWSVTGLSS